MKFRYILLLPVLCVALLAVYSSNKTKNNQYESSRQEITLRKLLHELLRSAGDSTSGVLPVQQVAENEYQLAADKSFAVSPDSFVNIVNRTVKQGKLPVNFTATVTRKKDKQLVYGFESPVAGTDGAACLGRKLPEDDYYISFLFPPAPANYSGYWLAAVVTIAACGWLWLKKRKSATGNVLKEKESTQEQPIQKGCIKIGQYLFDPNQQWLELNGHRIALTTKENKVLHILASSPGIIIERNVLQKEVWENEGVIVTRSLDMFISKLRKKLSLDADLKIENVHGKGYKLSAASYNALT